MFCYLFNQNIFKAIDKLNHVTSAIAITVCKVIRKIIIKVDYSFFNYLTFYYLTFKPSKPWFQGN